MTGRVTANHKAPRSRRGRDSGQAEPHASDEGVPLPKSGEAVEIWQRFIDEHIAQMTATGYAAGTISRYGIDTRRFCYWLLNRGCTVASAITPELCMAYQRSVYLHVTPSGKPNPTNSQRGMLTAARSFTGFLKKRGYALTDPGLAFSMPRSPKHLPRDILTEEEITRLLSMPDVSTIRGYRDRTMLEVLYATGMRSGELFNLDVEDVNFEAEQIHIREGKGRNDRVVPLGEIAVEYLAGYLRNIRPRFVRDPKERALFVWWKGRRIKNAEPVLVAMRRYLRKARIEKEANLHTFRHTCATHMLRNGAGIRHIQELLGHSTLTTTERYTKVEIGDLRKVHAEFHPRKGL